MRLGWMPSSSAAMLAVEARRAADVGMAGHHHDVAVLGDVDLRARFAAGIEPVAARRRRGPGWARAATCSARWPAPGARLLVADHREDRAVRGLGALLGGILQAQLDRIHAELLGQLIHHALDREGADRRARRAVGRDLGAVGDDVEALREHVRDVVGREGAARGAADRRARERARLQVPGALAGDDRAVLLGADLDGARRARGRARGAHHLLARHHHLDRPARLPGQHQRDRLEIDDGLAAEPAADLGRDRPDVALRDARHQRAHGADHELALARAPHRDLAVAADADQAGVRLDIALVHGLGLEAALDDHFGFLEARPRRRPACARACRRCWRACRRT